MTDHQLNRLLGTRGGRADAIAPVGERREEIVMYRIATRDLKNHVGKLVGIDSGPRAYVGTLKGRGARISAAGSGQVDSTWILQTRWKDIEFHPGNCEIYSMQYEPVGSAWWLG